MTQSVPLKIGIGRLYIHHSSTTQTFNVTHIEKREVAGQILKGRTVPGTM